MAGKPKQDKLWNPYPATNTQTHTDRVMCVVVMSVAIVTALVAPHEMDNRWQDHGGGEWVPNSLQNCIAGRVVLCRSRFNNLMKTQETFQNKKVFCNKPVGLVNPNGLTTFRAIIETANRSESPPWLEGRAANAKVGWHHHLTHTDHWHCSAGAQKERKSGWLCHTYYIVSCIVGLDQGGCQPCVALARQA